jgi:hypothetical protein
LFTAGQLIREMAQAVKHSRTFKASRCTLCGLLLRNAIKNEWQRDIVCHIERRDQVERLNNESDPSTTKQRPFHVTHQ